MKITMYELLGMIKDGKAPKKVRYRYSYLYKDFKFDGETSNYISDKDFLFGEDITAMLNDEVEIIEEKKIPEKLKNYYDENLEEYVVKTYIKGIKYQEIFNSRYDEMIISKINEVLDYLKSKGE